MWSQNWTLRRNILQGLPTPEGSGPALTGQFTQRCEAERKENSARERVPNPNPCAPTPAAHRPELSISKLGAMVLKLERAPGSQDWGIWGWGGSLKHWLPSLNL